MSRMQRFDWQAGRRSSVVRRFLANSRRRTDLVSPLRRRLHFEPLEDRRMLAAVTVTNDFDIVNGDTSSIANLIASDGGDGIALREAIEAANMDAAADTIDFDGGLDGGTILLTLGNGNLDITEALTIDASSLSGGMTIDAGNGTDGIFNTADGFRIFDIDDGTATDLDVTLRGLTLTGGDPRTTDLGGHGGAIRSRENLAIIDSTILGNAASGFGGGIIATGTTTITTSTISGNTAVHGGGIFNSSGTITITSSTISGNSASVDGGGIRGSGTITITSSTISGNSASVDGGGIDATGTTTITSSTISGNSASVDGGGIDASGTTTITSSTITDNFAATGLGGGVASSGNIYTNTEVTHSIIAGNTGSTDIAVVFGTTNSFISNGHNLIGTGNTFGPKNALDAFNASGDQTLVADPNLGPLADNGGPTQTHALSVGSPALDAGDAAIASPPANDQRGAPYVRIFDGDGIDSAVIDIGAYERQDVVPAQTLVVDTLADENDGNFSAGDFSLREAIGLANGNAGIAETITFDASLSGGTIPLTLGELVLDDSVTIDASNLAGGLTIDAGHGLDTLPETGDGFRIFHIDDGDGGTNIDVELRALTLTGGDVTGSGGAILSRENLSLVNSVIFGNSAGLTGGGISTPIGTTIISSSTISENSAGANGGGIDSTSGDVTVTGSTISDNSSDSAGGGIGIGGNLTVTTTTISGNSAGSGGGGIFAPGGTTIINSSTISGNSAGTNGGGIDSFSGDVTVTGSTISDNTSGSDGGGIGIGGNLTVTSSTISGNSASDTGGGIYAPGGTTIINSSTISGNSADASGGGIFARTAGGAGALDIEHSNIAGNMADADNNGGETGGGIFAAAGLVPTLNHTIVADNSRQLGTTDDVSGTVTANWSLIETISGATINGANNVHNADPQLTSLADNGGPTLTHELLAGSPALDAGDPAAMAGMGGIPLFDQRGDNYGRVQNGQIDIGAFEVRDTLSADFDSSGFITGLDFLLWQIGFGIPAPDAVKTDGDADNDLDADDSDLDVWELQYGTAAPIVAAASALIATEPVAEPSLASSELADVALAVALAEEADWVSGKQQFVAHSPPLEYFSAEPSQRNDSVASPGISSSASTSTPRDDERHSPEEPGPWEDTVDEVFASVFE